MVGEKLRNGEYISNALYLQAKIAGQTQEIPAGFDLEHYNAVVLDKLYQKYQNYFETMYEKVDPKIRIDEEQAKAILADEDYALIIAGAGTGKTTTMAAKVKYLVDIKKVDPAKILVMSYTRKATEELEKRIVLDFGIPAYVTTFHSLGLMYIRQVFQGKYRCAVLSEKEREEIFMNYFREKVFPYKAKVKRMMEVFDPKTLGEQWVFGEFFRSNYDKYADFGSYFVAFKKAQIEQIPDIRAEAYHRVERLLNNDPVYTIKGERVRSHGEAVIANFLFCNGVEYQYESVYEEVMDDNRTYRPDFKINFGGEDIYIEYFGMSDYNVAQQTRYEKIRQMKEDYHRRHKTRFIALDRRPGKRLTDSLREALIEMGVKLTPKTPEEVFSTLMDQNLSSQFYRYKNFLYKCVDTIKSSTKRRQYKQIAQEYLTEHLEKLKAASWEMEPGTELVQKQQFEFIQEFYEYYQAQLLNGDEWRFDFSDLIYYANEYIEKLRDGDAPKFDYVIIDEYQDISQERYELLKQVVRRDGAKVVAVGDDWQSIYAFSGSRIDYIYNFETYFPGAKLLNITRTYRNSQELINASGEFVMRNEKQIKKELVSSKSLAEPIKLVEYEPDEEYEATKQLILEIHRAHPEREILILARTNRTIDRFLDDDELRDGIGSQIQFLGYNDIRIDGMTIHSSKGLTSDEVIVMGLKPSFPSLSRPEFWLIQLMRPVGKYEGIPFAEERRIFYVALTRTRNHVYLMVNRDKEERSCFIFEIEKILADLGLGEGAAIEQWDES